MPPDPFEHEATVFSDRRPRQLEAHLHIECAFGCPWTHDLGCGAVSLDDVNALWAAHLAEEATDAA